jgi:hypothetical protein
MSAAIETAMREASREFRQRTGDVRDKLNASPAHTRAAVASEARADLRPLLEASGELHGALAEMDEVLAAFERGLS